HLDLILPLLVRVAAADDLGHLDRRPGGATFDADVARVEVLRNAVEQEEREGPLVVADLEVVEPVQPLLPRAKRPLLVGAGEVRIVHQTPPRSMTSTRRSLVRRTTYWTATRSVDSSLCTSSASICTTSPSQRWRAAWRVNCRAAASSGLLGAK